MTDVKLDSRLEIRPCTVCERIIADTVQEYERDVDYNYVEPDVDDFQEFKRIYHESYDPDYGG